MQLDGVFEIAELDPTKEPKEIRSPRWFGNMILYCDGIYRVEDNGDLTLCLYARYGINPGEETPKDFELEDGKDQVLIRLRRPMDGK